jgi:hypothetical protein
MSVAAVEIVSPWGDRNGEMCFVSSSAQIAAENR